MTTIKKTLEMETPKTIETETPKIAEIETPQVAEMEIQPVTEKNIDPSRIIQANNLVKNHVIASMTLGLVPLPIFDLVALASVQLKMVHCLCNQYEVKYSKNIGISLIAALNGALFPVTATIALSSMLKIIPGFGSLASGASVSILGGAITYATGKVFVQHFESGGTLLNFNVKKYRESFKKAVKEGKSAVSDLQNTPVMVAA